MKKFLAFAIVVSLLAYSMLGNAEKAISHHNAQLEQTLGAI